MKKKMYGIFKAFVGMVVMVVLLLSSGLPAYAAQEGDRERWQFSITPYLWLPSIKGTLNFSIPPGTGGSPEVDVGQDYLSSLKFAFMLKGEARWGDWSIFTDVIHLYFSDEEGSVKSVSGPGGNVQIPVNVDTSSDLRGLAWQLAGGYTVARGQSLTLDVFGGVRYFGVTASVDWHLAGPLGQFPQSGSYSEDKDLWDGIVGVRGKVGLGGDWFIPYYLDIGTGSSALTWQGLAGIGYSFKWGDMLLAYRHLYYDQKDGGLLQNFSFSGPALGANIYF